MSHRQDSPCIRHVAGTSLTVLGGSLAFAAWIVLCVLVLDSFSERPKFQWNRSGGTSDVSFSKKAPAHKSTPGTPNIAAIPKTAMEKSPNRPTGIVSSHRYHGGMRYTAMGWQNPHHWQARRSQASQISIHRLNPMLWAAMMWLASIGALVSQASPAEVLRVVGVKHEGV